MPNLSQISDNVPLYKIKKYKHALEMMNENVPLNIVKRRLHAQAVIELANNNQKKETKMINRKCSIMDAKLRERAIRVIICDPNSDKLCAKCEYNPNYHPYGCNMKLSSYGWS